jgi:hypothetical protein
VLNKTYTAKEAREKLGGISPETLKRYVESGKIRKYTPPTHKTKGYYDKGDVEALAEAMQKFIEIYTLTETEEKPQLALVRNEDELLETVRIDQQYFGDQIHAPEKRLYWFRICPNGDYILKHHGITIGYFSMQGIKPEAVDRLFLTRKGNPKTQPDDMMPMIPGQPIETYISMIAVKANETQLRTKTYGYFLLMHLGQIFVNLATEGVDIRTIWAKSGTVSGMKLCKDFGFTELGYINNDQIGFKLDIAQSNLPMVQRYREALAEYKNTH